MAQRRRSSNQISNRSLAITWQDRLREYLRKHRISDSAVVEVMFSAAARHKNLSPVARAKGEDGVKKILSGDRRLPLNPKAFLDEFAVAVAELVPGNDSPAEKQRQIIDFIIEGHLRGSSLVLDKLPQEARDAGQLRQPFSNGKTTPLEGKETADLLQRQLVTQQLRRVAPPIKLFRDAGFLDDPARKCIGEVISMRILSGAQGLAPGGIVVTEGDPPPLDPSIAELLPFSVEGDDNVKAVITGWGQMPYNVNRGRTTIRLARTMYSTKAAMMSISEAIFGDIAAHKIKVFDLPPDQIGPISSLHCNFHCDGIVLTGDKKIILAQRGSGVENNKGYWQASFGEGMNWLEDSNRGGIPHPIGTFWRAMRRELGLHADWMEAEFKGEFDIRFFELAFSPNNFAQILFSFIEVPGLSKELAISRAKNSRQDMGEQVDFAAMDFTPAACAAAVARGEVEGRQLNDSGRFNIMLAAMYKFESPFIKELMSMDVSGSAVTKSHPKAGPERARLSRG